MKRRRGAHFHSSQQFIPRTESARSTDPVSVPESRSSTSVWFILPGTRTSRWLAKHFQQKTVCGIPRQRIRALTSQPSLAGGRFQCPSAPFPAKPSVWKTFSASVGAINAISVFAHHVSLGKVASGNPLHPFSPSSTTAMYFSRTPGTIVPRTRMLARRRLPHASQSLLRGPV